MSIEISLQNPAGKSQNGKLNELGSIIAKNMDDLKSYLKFLHMQQQALIKGNLPELEQSVLNQEKILSSIDENQNLTTELMLSIIKENSLEIKSPGIRGFLESIKDTYKIIKPAKYVSPDPKVRVDIQRSQLDPCFDRFDNDP